MKSRQLNYLRSPFRTFLFTLSPYRGRFLAMCLLIIVGNIFNYALPYFLKLIVDGIAEHPRAVTFADVSVPFTLFALSLILKEILWRIGHVIGIYLVPDAFRHITTALYSGLIKRPASYFENKFSGDLGRRIEQIGVSTSYFLDSFPWEAGWIVLAFITSAFILSLTHVYMFLTFVLWGICFILTSIPILIWHYKASAKVAASHAHLSGKIVDTLSNIPLVQSFGGVQYEEIHNAQMTGEVVQAERKMWWISVLDKFQCGISLAVLSIALMYVSIVLFARGEFSVGDFVLIGAIIPELAGVVWMFGEIAIQTSKRYGELSDAVAHLRDKQEQLEGGNATEVLGGEYSIAFSDVHFQYSETSAPVFEKFSLHIAQGERVGIVGTSGAGKSTLVKLLLRQHAYVGGNIRIGGIPIEDFSLEAFHKLISYVPQDTSLFHRSLFEKIKYAKTDANKEDVLDASKKANVDEFITRFPEGYETKVGERGVKLSGGQRQRIALARAILKNAPILVLDEATSSLDSESETLIQDALSELFKGNTVIAIAHRLSTLRAMDRIVVLENGLVVESGTPKDLLEKEGSLFRKMWQHQKDGFIS